MLECDAQELPFVMFTNVRSLSRPPVSLAVSRGTGLEDEHPGIPRRRTRLQPCCVLRAARCALRCVLCLLPSLLLRYAAILYPRGFHYIWRLFHTGDRGHNFVTAKNLVKHGGPSLRVITCYAVTYIPAPWYGLDRRQWKRDVSIKR